MIGIVLGFLAANAATNLLPINIADVDFGEAHFALIHHEKPAGGMYYSMTQQDGKIIIHDATTLMPDTRESGTLVIDGENFAPVSAVIDGDFDRTIFDADLKFDGSKGAGAYYLKRPNELEKSERPFDVTLPQNVTFRASVFGLVTGLPLKDGSRFDFQWFNSLASAVQDVSLEVTGFRKVSVPAGEFETFAVHVNAQPENIIYVTTEKPRRVVRIDVVGQEMRFERLLGPEE